MVKSLFRLAKKTANVPAALKVYINLRHCSALGMAQRYLDIDDGNEEGKHFMDFIAMISFLTFLIFLISI